ncbi:hypothetical protein FisN_14Hh133 [Fistulifera solaris]|uniref:subtilisin n=1 Tax=Fistulifera solaris TaxID=1519565 RepID=A0A1Z5K8R5_FISSO|nr:hypothetical protein FisN_14Hh133 [Fistulifera solaris]|eukprot:GAX22511.1 hypothetical protein FisN_14Hh133 [Fistulifera solaris]
MIPWCLLLSWLLQGAQALKEHPKLRRAVADTVITNEYIVVLQSSRNNLRTSTVERQPWFLAELTEEELVDLLDDDAVAFIEQNTVYTTAFSQKQDVPPWGLDRVDQDELPLSNSYTYKYTGRGVNAYILDSGILVQHAEFQGRAACLQNFIDDSPCDDDTGHGTHVAGIIGGTTYGIAKNIQLKALKVCRNGSCPKSAILAALDYVASETGKRVVNMSFQGEFSQAMEDAQQRVVDSGAVIVVAAGNGFNNACSTYAKSSLSISVGATTKQDARASFSNYGPCVDLWAPGDGITSASIGGNGVSGTATLKGTSFAAPHVSGIVALHLERGVDPMDVKEVLLNHTKMDVISGMSIDDNNRLAHIPASLEPLGPVCLDDRWGRDCRRDSDCCEGHICKRVDNFPRKRRCYYDDTHNSCLLRGDTGQRCLFNLQCCSMQCNSRRCM